MDMEKRFTSASKPVFDVTSSADYLLKSRPRIIESRPLPPPRTAFAALAMLVVGTVLFIAGLAVFFDNSKMSDRARNGALPMICLGAVLLIPGTYASYILYGAWKGWRGFDYSQIPSYDDE